MNGIYDLLTYVGLPVSTLLVGEQLGIPSGLENVSAVAVLGFLMYLTLNGVCKQLGTISQKLDELNKTEQQKDTTTTKTKGK